MKSVKAAAVIAGTVALAGAAAPASAQDPTGLDSTVDMLDRGPVHVVPLHFRPDVLGTKSTKNAKNTKSTKNAKNTKSTKNPESQNTVPHILKGATARPDSGGGLLGGLPLHG